MFRQFFRPSHIAEVTVSETVVARTSGTHQLVDVREQDEWDEGHMAGAIFIPLGELAARAGELDPAKPVITICHAGQRSLYAAETLDREGFAEVASMAGGMISWENAGQPIER